MYFIKTVKKFSVRQRLCKMSKGYMTVALSCSKGHFSVPDGDRLEDPLTSTLSSNSMENLLSSVLRKTIHQ